MPAIKMLIVMALTALAAPAHAQEKRLDYKQEQLLKDATFYLDQVEGTSDALAAKIKDWKPGDTSIQLGTVQNYIGSKDKAVQSLKNVDSRLKQLPAEHSKVKPEKERYDKLIIALSASEKKLNEVNESLTKVVKQGEGAGYKADFDRLKEINQMFGNPQILESQPEQAIEIVKQISAVKAERARIAEKYADLLKQRTNHSDDMNATLKYFDQQFGKFDAATKTYATEAPAKIDANVAEAIKMGNEAVAEKKHLYFGPEGGVKQRLEWAETRYSVLAAISPDAPETAAAKKKIEDARVQVKQMKASLNDAIIAANAVPAEPYNGPDKAQLVDLVKTKWAESGNTGEVKKMGLNSQNWRRDTRWEWDGSRTWNKVDKSRIQGFVVVKTDDKVASIYYINLIKDHLAQDSIKAYFFNDPKTEVDVSNKVLLKSVK